MFFSFVIPHRESESPQKLISTILHSTVDFDYEIFTVTGNNPTLQRNECAKLAQGQFLYFLDCDSHIDINSLTIASNLLKENQR